jgi:hypothetical protein
LEPLTGLAMWSSEPQIIELVKGERGLGKDSSQGSPIKNKSENTSFFNIFLLIFTGNGSIFANPPKVGTMGSPNPAKLFLVILCEI